MRHLDPGTLVRIRRYGVLRGTVATVLHPADGGYELTFLSPQGLPQHAVLNPIRLRVLVPGGGAGDGWRVRDGGVVPSGRSRG